MARIFISYSRADTNFVEQFLPLAKRLFPDHEFFYDDHITGGEDWWQRILTEIAQADLFIYLLSNDSLESDYCQAEFREAQRLHKAILPVIVRRLQLQRAPDDIQSEIRRLNWVDMQKGFKDVDAYTRLQSSIRQYLLNLPASVDIPTPISPKPIPEPIVRDKQDSQTTVAYIGGIFLLVSVIIAGIFGLWQGVFANNQSDVPTTQAVQAEPTTGQEALETVFAQQTSLSLTEQAFNQTATIVNVQNATATAQQVEFNASETSAVTTIEFLSATPPPATNPPTVTSTNTPEPPTLTPTPDIPEPEQVAIEGVTSNREWENLVGEGGYVREFDGVEMVLVPGGCFVIGSEDGDSDEENGNEGCLAPFWIDRTEVTNEQYGSTGCEQYSSELDQPRNCINWFAAQAFCEIRGGRLPTEAQWEFAARGADELMYPWGDEFVADNVVYSGNANNESAFVGSRPDGASWVGALDMSGNVWEWTSSIYEDYPYASDGREDLEDTGSPRVLRGGSFFNTSGNLRLANRVSNDPSASSNYDGFRCVRAYNP